LILCVCVRVGLIDRSKILRTSHIGTKERSLQKILKNRKMSDCSLAVKMDMVKVSITYSNLKKFVTLLKLLASYLCITLITIFFCDKSSTKSDSLWRC